MVVPLFHTVIKIAAEMAVYRSTRILLATPTMRIQDYHIHSTHAAKDLNIHYATH